MKPSSIQPSQRSCPSADDLDFRGRTGKSWGTPQATAGVHQLLQPEQTHQMMSLFRFRCPHTSWGGADGLLEEQRSEQGVFLAAPASPHRCGCRTRRRSGTSSSSWVRRAVCRCARPSACSHTSESLFLRAEHGDGLGHTDDAPSQNPPAPATGVVKRHAEAAASDFRKRTDELEHDRGRHDSTDRQEPGASGMAEVVPF